MVTVGVVVRWPLTMPKGHQHELHDARPAERGHVQFLLSVFVLYSFMRFAADFRGVPSSRHSLVCTLIWLLSCLTCSST